MATRLPFLIEDLANQIYELSPESEPINIELKPRSYKAVVSELTDHFGSQLTYDIRYHPGEQTDEAVRVGNVTIRKAV